MIELICKKCGKKEDKKGNYQKYCSDCIPISRKEHKERHYKIHKERIKKNKRIWNIKNKERLTIKRKNWSKENKEKVKEYHNKYHNKKETRFKDKIRGATYHKYGKLPKGWQYHHIPPYRVDVFLCFHNSEHKKIEWINGGNENVHRNKYI